jgi:hypothetical protein
VWCVGWFRSWPWGEPFSLCCFGYLVVLSVVTLLLRQPGRDFCTSHDWWQDPPCLVDKGERYTMAAASAGATREASHVFRGDYYPATSAASSAPSSQQASRSFLPGGPVTQTGGLTARHCRPVVIDSTARTAPPVSMPPCTYRP